MRSISEILCSDKDESTTRQHIYDALKNSSTLYEIDEQDLVETIKWLADISSTKSSSLLLPLAVAFFEAENDDFIKSNISFEAKRIFKGMNNPTINTVEQSYQMTKIVEEVNENVLPILSKLKDPEILTLIR